MILGILPIYCWTVALFSIPIAILDIVGAFSTSIPIIILDVLGASSAINSLYYLAAAIPLLI